MLVLDTNVVLDVLHFDDPAARPLKRALEMGQLRGAATPETFDECRRVLAYPGFALDTARQRALLERYRAAATMFDAAVPAGVPRCVDADDQKFLDLAAQLGLPLVSKDRAVLRLRRRAAPRFSIFTPAEAAAWLAAQVAGFSCR